jgi:Fe-S-cluster containining protein
MIRKGFDLKAASKKLKSTRANPSNYSQWKLLKQYGKKSCPLKLREPSLEIKNKVDLNPFFEDYEALIQKVDQLMEERLEKTTFGFKKNVCLCGHENIGLQLIEAVYIHSKINKLFASGKREQTINTATAAAKNKDLTCPFKKNSDCNIYDIRPARCRMCGITDLESDKQEVQETLYKLSQELFLAFSGRFGPPNDFTFSMGEAISGKYIQKYFDYLYSTGRQ